MAKKHAVRHSDSYLDKHPSTESHKPHSHMHHNGTTLGGVTHGIHHGVTHGAHYVSAHKNKHHVHHHGKLAGSKTKPNPHAGGAHGWVYTTKPGDTNVTLQEKFWPGSYYSGAGKNATSRTFLYSYANNRELLKGNVNKLGQIKPGTRIIA